VSHPFFVVSNGRKRKRKCRTLPPFGCISNEAAPFSFFTFFQFSDLLSFYYIGYLSSSSWWRPRSHSYRPQQPRAFAVYAYALLRHILHLQRRSLYYEGSETMPHLSAEEKIRPGFYLEKAQNSRTHTRFSSSTDFPSTFNARRVFVCANRFRARSPQLWEIPSCETRVCLNGGGGGVCLEGGGGGGGWWRPPPSTGVTRGRSTNLSVRRRPPSGSSSLGSHPHPLLRSSNSRVASGSKGHIARQKAKFSQTVNKFH
jgi:hypothetical protein